MKKSQKKHTDEHVRNINEAKKPDAKSNNQSKLSRYMIRTTGAFFLALSVSIYAQLVPLLFVFIGAYLGIPSDASMNDMDSMIWLLTSITMMILSIFAFIAWIKFVWRRFITDPKPLFKRKHA